MNYNEVVSAARGQMGPVCKACPVCNGRACGSQIPGPGAKGTGDVAIRNFEKWRDIRVQMDPLVENAPIDTTLTVFGHTFKLPLFAAPVGAMKLHYGDKHTDVSYNDILVSACAQAGILAFTGDGMDATVMQTATQAIRANGGVGIPTVKPWALETIVEKMALIQDCGCFAVAMDVDGCGLPFLRNVNPPSGPKSVAELADIIKAVGKPFIVKGIMTPAGALKAAQAGASAIVVSNHGGRVLDQVPATAEVLADIVDALRGSGVNVFVDGGIRTGVDVFKALALGADAALIARPFVVAVYGAGAEGVQAYVDKIGAELTDTMMMCGARKLSDITRDMVRVCR